MKSNKKKTIDSKKGTSVFIQRKKDDYAKKLKQRRKSIGMSQANLAYLTGVDRKTINRIENGHFSPSLDTMLRIALVLKLNTAEAITI